MFLILWKELFLTMCWCTLIGVLFPNTVQWGRSVTHPGPVATFSKCLCLAKGGWFTWFYFLPSVLVRQFDTSEKATEGYICFRAASHGFQKLAAGTRLARAPHLDPGLLQWDRLASLQHVRLQATLLTLLSELCLGIVVIREEQALMLVPGPQGAAWLQVQGRNAWERVGG